MKRIALTLAAIVLFGVTGVGADERAPALVMPTIAHDFGKVFERKDYEYSFVVRNQGAGDLVISDVKPGCGCTVADFDTLVAPGREGHIKLTIAGNKVHGSFEKTAIVYTNDPDHREMTLTMAGEEIPYVNVAPGERIFLDGYYGEEASETLTITSNEKDLDFKVVGLSSNIDDKITYRWEKGDHDGEYRVIVKKNRDLPAMNAFGSLYVTTNSDSAAVTTVQVQVMTKGTITVQPSTVNFGRLEFPLDGPGTPVVKSVTLLRTKGEFAIESLKVSNDNFKVNVEEVVPGQRYHLKVTFTPPKRVTPNQNELGDLTVFTNDPTEPTLALRLVARAR